MADGSASRLQRITDYPALLNEAWAQAHAPREANAPTVISTFAGCGGSSLGYHMAGFRELLAVEWEQNAADTFRLNFPHVPLYHGDIAKLSVAECLRLANIAPGELDVFDGSPPCQGFSTSGKRELGDQRNQLFREYCRLLEGLRPRAFVMENVSGMVKGDFKIIFAEILRTLKGCGYRVKARLMCSAFFGVPQARERMIFIGVRNDIGREPSHPAGWSEPIVASKVLPIKSLDYDTKGQFSEFNLDINRKAFPTITKGNQHHLLADFGNGKRKLTIAEVQAVGSFPPAFMFYGTASLAWQRIGNSVPPLLMRSIARHVRALIAR